MTKNNEEVVELSIDDLLPGGDVTLYVQIRDDDGNLIEERPATQEEIMELMGFKGE